MKKIGLILFLSLTFFSGAFTQPNKLSFGVIGIYDNYTLKTRNNFGFNHEYASKLSFTSGINIQYNLNEKCFIKSGILYVKKGYEVDFNFIAIDPIYLDPAIPNVAAIDINVLAIPTMFGYYIINKDKFKLSSSIGMFNEYVFKTTSTFINHMGTEYKSSELPSNMSRMYFSSQLNLGVEYHFSERWYLGLSPYFRYAFNTIGSSKMDYSPISYGGGISLNYKLTNKPKEE